MTAMSLELVPLAPGRYACGRFRLKREGKGSRPSWVLRLDGKPVATVLTLGAAQAWIAGQR